MNAVRADSDATPAAYAVHEGACRGRVHREPDAPSLPPFALDRHRVLHSAAFRRLQHKTQVFVTHEGDHFRTRLTHTLEVAAHARRLAAALRLNADLAETIALAHDLGHPPFGHAGEAALAERMAGHGGFEHNLQSLRVVDYLEHPYPDFRGLNLTFEVREGLLKHRTRYDRPDGGGHDADTAALMAAGPNASLEAQVVNLADELAYTLHDVEDGLLHDLIDPCRLTKCALWASLYSVWNARHPDKADKALRRPVLDALLDVLVDDATSATRRAAEAFGVRSADDVRRAPAPLARLSDERRAGLDELQALLRETVYTHPRIGAMDREAFEVIGRLFDAYDSDPSLLPPRFAARVAQQGTHRVICDYVAGMTDRFCRSEFDRRCADVGPRA